MTSWATVSFSKRNVICNYSLWTGKGLRTTDVETLTATKKQNATRCCIVRNCETGSLSGRRHDPRQIDLHRTRNKPAARRSSWITLTRSFTRCQTTTTEDSEVSFASLQQSTSQYLTNLQRNIYLLRDVLRHCIEGTVVASYLLFKYPSDD